MKATSMTPCKEPLCIVLSAGHWVKCIVLFVIFAATLQVVGIVVRIIKREDVLAPVWKL
jgi:hypothetical protein